MKCLKILIPVCLIVGAYLLFRCCFSIHITDKAQMEALVERAGMWAPVFYVLLYMIRPLVLLPAAIVSASAGYIWGPAKGFIILTVAANLAANLEFIFARYVARESVSRFLKGKMAKIDKKIERHGFLTVLLIRLIPNAPWDVQNLTLGLTEVKHRDYFVATLIGMMPGSFALVLGGEAVIKTLTDPRKAWMIAVAVAVFAAVMLLQRFIKKRHGHRIDSGASEKE